MTAIPGTAMPSPLLEKKPDTQPQQAPPETVTLPVQPYNVVTAPANPIAATLPTTPKPVVSTSPEMQVVNVGEIEKSITTSSIDSSFHAENEVWYNNLLAWMSFGAAAGIVAAFLGLIHSRLFYLAPLGPTIGTLAWYARDFFQKHIMKFDPFPN